MTVLTLFRRWRIRYHRLTLFKRPVVALLVLSLAGMAQSQSQPLWSPVHGEPGLRKFIDPASVVRDGPVLRLEELMDFPSPRVFSGVTVLSVRWRSEYHCTKRQTRVLSYQGHGESLGQGPALVVGSELVEWTDIPDGSLAHSVWLRVCQGVT